MSAVRAGYKQTEVGVIPGDWEISNLESITDPKRAISYGIVQTGPNLPGGIRCLRVVDIDDGRINTEEMICTSKAISDSYKRTILKADDLVMPLRGKVGDVAIVTDDMVGWNLTRGVALIAVRPDWSARYCKQFISSSSTRARLEQSMNGSALQEIPIATLRSFKIALPPTKAEQETIAEALSDADALIESLEQLLTKKRHLKQGTMQELLTGKKRLPGFSGRWESKLIEELERAHWIRLSRGKVISKKDIERVPGDFPIYSSSVTASGMFGCYGDYMFDEELITWSVDGGGHFFHRPKHKFSVTNVCGYIRLETSKLAYQYVAAQLQLLHSQMKFDYQDKAHPSIIRKAYRLCIPPLEEQEAIAAVFFDIDAEITDLEAQLSKTRALKQGMMQKLLTGEIRLI